MLRPLIAICGTTGVGKSNLAIDIAVHLSKSSGSKGARIINADSMQVYSGMDVITNKVPEAERQGVEHLLMGFKRPGEQYIVGQWVQDAIKLIDETHSRNQIPIVVGGTSYWIQHLMFSNRLLSSPSTESDDGSQISQKLAQSISQLPPELLSLFNTLPENAPSAAEDPDIALMLHALISALDPPIASRWHWRDTRKVLRSLEIIKKSGRTASEVLTEQSETKAAVPRYRTLCLWIYAKPSVLNARLDARVDRMVEQGLLNEIRALREIALSGPSDNAETDYTLGIYQAIGYKEFHQYLSVSEPSETAFKDAVERMKISTRQYAKRQISWIRNKLFPAVCATNAEAPSTSLYLLDATDLDDKWVSYAQQPALQIAQDFLNEKELPDPRTLSTTACDMLNIERKSTDPIAVLNARRKITCPTCTAGKNQPVMIEEGLQWEAHQRTKVHKRLASKVDAGNSQGRHEGNRKHAYDQASSKRDDALHEELSVDINDSIMNSP